MGLIRAQLVLQGGTALPEDRFVNTWHFDAVGDAETEADALTARLEDFYAGTNGGTQVAVGTFLSEFVSRTAEVRCYNLADPTPRVPTTRTFTLPAHPGASNVDLPEEVAIVLSLEAEPPITPRRRGRLYIGPLNATAVGGGTTTTPARVDVQARQALVQAATRVLDGNASGAAWVIYSPTSGLSPSVATGFCDDAFDTQRRRGPSPTGRLTFPYP